MKFLIKATHNPVIYEGSNIVYGTGESPFIANTEDLACIQIGEDKVRFITGLSVENINSNISLLPEEKKIYGELCEKARERVVAAYGVEALDSTNQYFWNGARTTLTLTNTSFSDIYDDTESVDDLIFRMQIIGGGYSSIAPTLEIAERTGKKFYLTDEEEFAEKNLEEEFGHKRKAMAALDKLLDQAGIDPLMYITWLTVDNNNGLTRNTPKGVYETILMQFIEGKHVKYGKKDCAKIFYDNYMKWKSNKENVIATATVAAAYHFGMIYLDEGSYKTSKRLTTLGSTLEEALATLMLPSHTNEFIDIKKSVDEKLNS